MTEGTWRGCDSQCAQEQHAAANSLPRKKGEATSRFASPKTTFFAFLYLYIGLLVVLDPASR